MQNKKKKVVVKKVVKGKKDTKAPKKKVKEKPIKKTVKNDVEKADGDKKPAKKKAGHKNIGKRGYITQYNMKGERIRTFPSLSHAVQVMGISRRAIEEYIDAKRRHAGGYLWGYDRDAFTAYNTNKK